METTTQRQTADRPSSVGELDPVVTLSQLAAQLGVSVQPLYDLRSQGRGPRGFRVGRELRFRVSEIAAWLTQMEADDAERHRREAVYQFGLTVMGQLRDGSVDRKAPNLPIHVPTSATSRSGPAVAPTSDQGSVVLRQCVAWSVRNAVGHENPS